MLFVVTIKTFLLGHLLVRLVFHRGPLHTCMHCTQSLRKHSHTQSCFVDQVWKKESSLSLWDSHTCCTGLHSKQKHTFIHRHRESASNTHTVSHPSTHIETYRHTNTHRNTDKQMGAQTISLTLLHSLSLSVITTDALFSWFNFSETKTKSATFYSILAIKTKDALSRIGWHTESTHLPKQSHARAIKKPLFWFLIISGGL